jgi:hypothetical protein
MLIYILYKLELVLYPFPISFQSLRVIRVRNVSIQLTARNQLHYLFSEI